MRHTGFIKFIVIIFIVVAVINHRSDTLKGLAIKTGLFLRGMSTAPVDEMKQEKSEESQQESTENKIIENKELRKTSAAADIDNEVIKVTPTTDSVVANFFANIVNKVLETQNGKMVIKEVLNNAASRNNPYTRDLEEKRYLATNVRVGNGKTVNCGDDIEISYAIYHKSDAHKKGNNKNLRTRITVGRNSLAQPLENAIIGMQEGGERKVVYFAEDPFGAVNHQNDKSQNAQYASEVRVEKVYSMPNNISETLRVFVHNPSRIGKRVSCGDSVNFVYKISDVSNKVLSDEKAANRMTLGLNDSNNLSKQVYSHIIDTYRDHVRMTIILNYKQAKVLIPDLKLNKAVPEQEMLIIDLQGFPSASLNEIQANSFLNKVLNSAA